MQAHARSNLVLPTGSVLRVPEQAAAKVQMHDRVRVDSGELSVLPGHAAGGHASDAVPGDGAGVSNVRASRLSDKCCLAACLVSVACPRVVVERGCALFLELPEWPSRRAAWTLDGEGGGVGLRVGTALVCTAAIDYMACVSLVLKMHTRELYPGRRLRMALRRMGETAEVAWYVWRCVARREMLVWQTLGYRSLNIS
jgi:hypothetical protein